jgi:Tfp pilus assembly protein PilF
MRKLLPVLVSFLSSQPLHSQFVRGKVVMQDGAAPPQKAVIERSCPPAKPFQETVAAKSGEYLWRVGVDTTSLKVISIGTNKIPLRCYLQARIPGFESGTIDIGDPVVLNRPELPTLTLRPAGSAPPPEPPKMSRAALKSWDLGTKAVTAQQWPEAERHLRDVLRTAPNFSLAWSGLAYSLESQQKPAEAREAYRRAIAADPTSLLPRVQLARLEAAAKLWPEASATAESLIALDKEHRYPEAFLHHGLVRYMLKDPENARLSLEQVIRLDPKRQMPQAEYLLGAALAAKGDRAGAVQHLNLYLEISPEVPNSVYVRDQIPRLTKPLVTTAAPAAEVPLSGPGRAPAARDRTHGHGRRRGPRPRRMPGPRRRCSTAECTRSVPLLPGVLWCCCD